MEDDLWQLPKVATQTRIWGLERVEREFEQVFDEAIRAGYDGIECRAKMLVEKEDALLQYVSSHAISIIGLHTNIKSFDTEDRKREISNLLECMNRASSKYSLISMGHMADYQMV